MTDFLPAIFLGIILSFTIGPVFFTILEISVSKGFKAAVFFNIGVVFSEIVFFAIAYASTSSLLESIQENPSWKILGGVLLSFYAGITLLGMYQNKEEASQYRFDPKSESPNIIKNMIKGKSIAIMIDQRVREGKKIDFFNNQATTTTIPAQLIKKYNCELVPVYIERRKNNYFKMFISKPIKIDKNKSVIEITKFLNNLLERMIVRNIDQWIWTHNRWKD